MFQKILEKVMVAACAFTGEPQARFFTKAFAVDLDIWLVLGAGTSEEGTELISGVELLSAMCEWEADGGTTSSTSPTSRLWASPDHLPTSTMEFTEIYDLGDADRVSFAVLSIVTGKQIGRAHV